MWLRRRRLKKEQISVKICGSGSDRWDEKIRNVFDPKFTYRDSPLYYWKHPAREGGPAYRERDRESEWTYLLNEVKEMLSQTRLVRGIIGLLLILSLVGVFLVLVSTSRYGPGVSPDSVAHVSTARNQLSGKGYIQYDGSPFVRWPPLFPTLLTSISLLGFDPLGAARYLNALCFGAMIFVFGLWLLKNIKPLPFALLGPAALLLSRPLIGVSVFVWTEPLFALFVLMFVVEAGEFLESGKSLSIVLLAISAALAFLTRYVGVTVVLVGLVVLLLKRAVTPIRKIVYGAMFCIISALPTVVWLIKNRAVFSSLTGERALASFPVLKNFWSMLQTVSQWFLPLWIPNTPRTVIFSLLFISMLSLLAAITIGDRGRWARSNLPQVMPSLCFLFTYIGYMVVSATGTAFDPIDNRLLSPAYVPLILLIVFTVDNVRLFPDKRSLRHALSIILITGFSLWLVDNAARTIAFAVSLARDGAGGYSATVWRESDLARHIKEYPLRGQIYSNAPEAVYILTGRTARLSPRKHPYRSPGKTEESMLLLKKSVASNSDTYLVWFEGSNTVSSLYSPEELRSLFEVNTVAVKSNGAVYLIR